MEKLTTLLSVAAVVVVPFVVGTFLARRLRLSDYGWKIGVVLFTLAFGSSVTYWGWRNDRIRTGIDLSGGAILVYQVMGDKVLDTVEMDRLIAAVSLRVNPGGVKEVTIRRLGDNQIEIIVPKVDEAEASRLENIISRTGKLEFRILADQRHHAELIERALKEESREIRGEDGQWLARWIPVKPGEENSFVGEGYRGIARRERTIDGRPRLEILVIRDNYNVTGDYLTNASVGTDRNLRPCVNFAFNAVGAERFGGLTSSHLPEQGGQFTYKLGIILDNFLYSAPSIQSTITDRGEITGSFTKAEVADLVNVLNAGALPATLSETPISKLVIGPTLGRDTIERSSNAILIASILVPIFMLGYYRFAGMVANFALVINVLCILAIMITVKAAFTLAGLAGLALTVGMAVDNNVLVYERLREELARGSSLRMAIRNAFARASTVIIDANVTTLISAVVLYVIGSDQVKGFAVALFLGVALSMFTAVWVARVIFEVAERKQWITEAKMLQLIGQTNIDFMRLFPVTVSISIALIVIGIAGLFVRGKNALDIDFTGGVSVQVVFKEGREQDTAAVRKTVGEVAKLPDVVVSDARVGEEPLGRRFVVNTSEQDLEKVVGTLKEVFGDNLEANSLKVVELTPIAAATGEQAEATTEKPAEAPASADPWAGGARAKLAFHLPINHDNLAEAFQRAIKQAGVPDTGLVEFSNPNYTEGDQGAYGEWSVRSKLAPDQLEKALAQLNSDLQASPYFPAANKIGGAVAVNTQRQAIFALTASWACMLVYLWIRFQGVAFGLAAVVALIHDVLIMLSAVALSYWLTGPLGFLNVDPFKINLTMVAAMLLIIGYSVNDTIIVFDRIREVRGKLPAITPEIVNQSVNQTLSRTLITSFTVLLVVLVLYALGGEAIRGMAFALLIGTLSGTYSSIYIAAPVLLWLAKPKGGQRAHGTAPEVSQD